MKKLASLLPRRGKLALLKWHLASSAGGNTRSLVMLDRSDRTSPLQVLLHKADFGIGVGLDLAAAMDRPFVYRMLYARLPAMLLVFSRSNATVRAVAADLSDGGDMQAAGLAFCSCRDDAILVPDPVFVNSGGYADFRSSSSMQPWPRRLDTVLWRGNSTGIGEMTTETMRADDPRLRQRVRMCLMLRSTPGADVKLSKTEDVASLVDRYRFACHGLFGGKIRQADWGRYKFALDVEGHTNAWSNFFMRLLLGCCVLKIQSEHCFRQWYYDRYEPMAALRASARRHDRFDRKDRLVPQPRLRMRGDRRRRTGFC
jgi:hypothetical protein